ERERQRLESLRKKQEAEEQRRRKVEEEKRRRQEEMKQKREERLRKALQARERVEQMEEEKKKRMEQKILQNDEKVRLPQVREEKVAEERSKKKLSKKHGEADARKQKVLRVVRAPLGPSCLVFLFLLQEEDEPEQPEPLQKRREDDVKEKGKRVLELRNLVEQKQVEQARESGGSALESAGSACPGHLPCVALGARLRTPGSCSVPGSRTASGCGLSRGLGTLRPSGCCGARRGSGCAGLGVCPPWRGGRCSRRTVGSPFSPVPLWFQKSISMSHLWPLKGAKGSRSPKVNENNYGMDLNSDDSTDDENDPRKPVPAWAGGSQLNQAVLHQYYHPLNVDQIFGLIPSPKLEDIFGKSKPRYFKRTSSAVWHSPP
ncbi:INCE protein, partial [Syrrhaptes paradoxus]|nr:INCE protein [Syrrhaptes paradoxus]